MAVLRCKMCGGDLDFKEGATICKCEYCGNTNTLPVVGSDMEMNLFNRANHLRMINEFDRAINAYEKILDSDDTNAEAHWGVVLSRYGIEYVEDPVTSERIPTCHRVQMTNILSDPDYMAAVDYADVVAAAEYKAQAEQIAKIQKEILAISSKEEPYDVFICYKESDDNGKRTVDSTLAQDIYYGLTESGYRVFFSRITLEDKLGQEYEPYIFAALNSAKVMIVVGTKAEYFNAVWVKNEWGRYLALMKKDRHRLLIPCYRDMDPYDLPDELSVLQSQDMSRIGFMQDLLRGIRKIIVKEPARTNIVQQNTGNTTSSAQIKRGYMALEDHEWDNAERFFEEALNLEPESAEAFMGKLLASEKQSDFVSWLTMQKNKNSNVNPERKEAFPEDTEYIEKRVQEYEITGYLDAEKIHKEYKFDCSYSSSLSNRKNQKASQLHQLTSERNLSRARQYAKGDTKQQIEDGLAEISHILDERIEQAKKEDEARVGAKKDAYKEHLLKADKRVAVLNEEAKKKREQDYEKSITLYKNASNLEGYEKAKDALQGMNGYKDCDSLAGECQKEIDHLTTLKQQEEAREADLNAKKKKRIIGIISVFAVASIVAFVVVTKIIIPNNNYNKAVALLDSGDFEAAYIAFNELDDYKDSKDKKETAQKGIWYNEGLSYMEEEKYSDAVDFFRKAGDFQDAKKKLTEANSMKQEENKEKEYQEILTALEKHEYSGLDHKLESLGDYKDSPEILKELNAYREALKSFNSDETYKGIEYFAPAMDLIKNGKYVHFSDDIVDCVNFFGPFLGKWKYSTGDDQLLSYTGKDSSKYHSIQNIEIKYTVTDGDTRESTIQVFVNKKMLYVSLPRVDYETSSIKEGSYVGGDFVFSLKDNNTLLIDFYGKSDMPEHVTVEYVKDN